MTDLEKRVAALEAKLEAMNLPELPPGPHLGVVMYDFEKASLVWAGKTAKDDVNDRV